MPGARQATVSLAQQLAARGLTQRQIAKQLRVHQTTVGEWLKDFGAVPKSLDTIPALPDAATLDAIADKIRERAKAPPARAPLLPDPSRACEHSVSNNVGRNAMSKRVDTAARERHARFREAARTAGKRQLGTWISREAAEHLDALLETSDEPVESLVSAAILAYRPRRAGKVSGSMARNTAKVSSKRF